MPGCTVPNCTNSFQKGFKLYRFPSDKERNLIWVQNCGRERGWKPTKHTCICEMHFEESQFESHRADGLRKLKPNAIPTVFSHIQHMRSYTRKPKKDVKNENALISSLCAGNKMNSVPENKISGMELNLEEGDNECSDRNIVIKGPDHTYPKFHVPVVKDEVENSNDNSATTEEVFINVSVASKFDDIPKTSGKERRFQPIKKLGKKEGTGDRILKTCQKRKHGRPPNSTKKFHNPAARKMIKISDNDEEETQIQEDKEDNPSSDSKCRTTESINVETKQCFVCGKVVEKGLSLFTLTNTTKVQMYQKLDRIVTGEMDLLLKEEGVLCSCCANLLNYMDRIEVELSMLRKAILNCIRKKCGMEFKTDTGQEKLIAASEEEEQGKLNSVNLETECTTEIDQQVTHKENKNCINSGVNIKKLSDENTTVEEIQCQICKFKSTYKSVMIFHLRQHLKDVYWCDFCNISLPNDAVTWIDHDDNSLLGLSASGDEDMEEKGVTSNHSLVENSTAISSENSDILITVVPVSGEDTITSKIVEAVACRNNRVEENSIDTNIESGCLKNSGSEKNTEEIRVLNEPGKIGIQEVSIFDDPKQIKNTHEGVSEPCMFSRFSYELKPKVLQTLREAKITETNYGAERIDSYQIMNQMEMIVLTEGEEKQSFTSGVIDSESNQLRMNLTPNLLTFSNEKILNVSMNDSEKNDICKI